MNAPSTLPAAGEQSGSRSARFEQLFQAYWTRVFGLLYTLTGDRAEAEDLALEAFWRLYQRPPKDGQQLGGWLYRVAANLGYNALRTQRRREHYEQTAGQMDLEERRSPDPGQLVEHNEQQRLVRQVLSSLSSRSARLLILRHSGLSYNELAEALEISPRSVGALLARAEKEFEKKYRRFAGEEG